MHLPCLPVPVPTPPELDHARDPAIAALLPLLDAALDTLTSAIAAAHPELYDDSRPAWLPPIERHARIAGLLLPSVSRLRRLLRRYLRAARLPPSDPNPSDFAF